MVRWQNAQRKCPVDIFSEEASRRVGKEFCVFEGQPARRQRAIDLN